jgi:hypothetical protein
LEICSSLHLFSQREVIAKLESAGRDADHAEYLLAGLALLEVRTEITATK